MRTFAEKPKPKETQQTTSHKAASPTRLRSGSDHEMNPVLHLHRTIGNRAVLRLIKNSGQVQRAPADTVTAAAVTADSVTVTNNGTGVTDAAIQVLKEIVAAIGETSAKITSGRRTPSEQADAMYTNLENTSVAAQKELYGPNGDLVIDVYVAGKAATPAKDAATIKQEMVDKINELGPSNVSKHCTENSVIDVAPSSITDDAGFQTQAEAHARVTKYLGPDTTPSDPAHHLEIT